MGKLLEFLGDAWHIGLSCLSCLGLLAASSIIFYGIFTTLTQ